MTKRLLSLILAITLLATMLGACSAKRAENSDHALVTESTTELVTDTQSFKLSYSQSDSLNPFESKTLNNQIVQNLVFDSLFTIDESFEVQPSIATSYAYEGKDALTVTIPLGIKFSDGSNLTAEDVVNSFYDAKKSVHWGNGLDAIDSASTVSETVIKFNLAYPNPMAHNLLTFAITNGKTDSAGYPIGSGRYKFGESDGTVFIEVNKSHENFNPHFTKITLTNITASESIDNAINIGNISYAYRDLAEGTKTKIIANKKAVNINNLVFVGINEDVGITSNEYIRRAISLAIDRDMLVKSAYQGYAKPATSVFNSATKLGRQTVIFSKNADTSASKQAIAQSEYSSDKLSLTLLVNKNSNKQSVAKLVKQQLENVGFKISIDSVGSKEYMSKIKNRAFDIYIGETKIPNDLSLKSFFSKSGSTRYGIDLSNSETKSAYNGYLKGKNEVGKFILEFSQEMPFVPLLYRQGMICYSKSMHGDMQGYVENYFLNIEDWYYN